MNNKNSYLNKKDIINSFNRAIHSYDQAAIMQRNVADNLFRELISYHVEPNTILDLGAGTGYGTRWLLKQYPKADVFAFDLAENMLFKIKKNNGEGLRTHYICADAEQLPFTSHSIDLIFSNLMLHWCSDIQHTILEIQRVLRPGGLLIFSTLGPDSMYELRDSWSQVDENMHVHSFIDFSDLNNYFGNAGFTRFNLRAECLSLKYQHMYGLLSNLKEVGVKNIHTNRIKGLTGKFKFKSFTNQYEKFRDENDMLPLTYQVFYGQAY